MEISRSLGEFGVTVRPKTFDESIWVEIDYTKFDRLKNIKMILMRMGATCKEVRSEIYPMEPNSMYTYCMRDLSEMKTGKYILNVQAETVLGRMFSMVIQLKKET